MMAYTKQERLVRLSLIRLATADAARFAQTVDIFNVGFHDLIRIRQCKKTNNPIYTAFPKRQRAQWSECQPLYRFKPVLVHNYWRELRDKWKANGLNIETLHLTNACRAEIGRNKPDENS